MTTNTSELKKLMNELKVQVAMADSSLNTFETKHSRASATRCRNYLMAIKKHCDSLRKDVLAESKKPKQPVVVEPVEPEPVVEEPDVVEVPKPKATRKKLKPKTKK